MLCRICRKKDPGEKSDGQQESNEVTKAANQQRKGVKRKPIIDNGIGDCLKMLLGKKTELQNKLEKSPKNIAGECSVVKTSSLSVDIKSPAESSEGKHDENSESNYELSEPGKRKRKRKRTKKSSGSDILYTSETSSIVSEEPVQPSFNISDNTITELRVSLENESANKNHIYFNEGILLIHLIMNNII